MRKGREKVLSFLIAFSFFITSMGLNAISVYASDINPNGEGNGNIKVILEEGFTGERKNVKPKGDGWSIIRNGTAATALDGYDTTGNYGKEKPSLGFGRLSGSTEEILESPNFVLNEQGTLSFWYKGQGSSGQPYTSTLKIEIYTKDKWTEIQGPDISKEGTFKTTIPKEGTKVRFQFNKNGGNLAIDDIVINYEEGTNPPIEKPIPISEARKVEKGKGAIVKGVVSFNDRNQTLHIQDDTGAIAISNYNSKIDLSSFTKGSVVQAKGTLDNLNGLIQIQSSEAILSSEQGSLQPKTLTIKELKGNNYDSQYVEIKNAVIDITSKTLTQGSDVLPIYYIPANINVKTGDMVNTVGTMGRYKDTVQIYGSSCTFTKIEPEDTEAPVIDHSSVTKASINKDLEIKAKVKDNKKVDKVILNYRNKGQVTYKNLAMKGDNNNSEEYSTLISNKELRKDGLEYYIEASDGANTSKVPKDGAYFVKVVDEDITGPEIYDLVPGEGANIGSVDKITIRASLRDESGIDKSSIKVFFNGQEVTAKSSITENSVSYNVEGSLKDGIYKVKIEAKDMAQNVSSREWSFRKGILNHYFGQLHSHTNISDGAGTLDEAYNWAKSHGADYFAVTDHSNWFDNDVKANIADGRASKAWTNALNTADKYNNPGNFTSIYGYEMTWSGSTGGWGHINTFNTPGFETRSNNKMDLKNYYNTLTTQPQSISQLNHPGKTFGDFADFGFYSDGADKVVNLVEVGNGEGPIRGSGYFPSYEYYTRALDKGWHLAPTNNQDNHKGNWFTSNNARTVIISEGNTREALYNAMRNKQVYASEDSNMTIDYTVNGQLMGSFLGEVDKLNFKINMKDDDSIKKVSIIGNGGVEVISKEFNSNSVNWEFELKPEYTYYYVKVVEVDKDIAVTAPVWVGENLNVGLTEIKVDKELSLPGEEIKATVGIYNNGDKAINNGKVEFFLNEINEGTKEGEIVIPLIDSQKTENVTLPMKLKDKGEYTIYAKASINVAGKERIFTKSIKVKVINPEDTYKVVVDGAHYNQYVTGDYPGKLNKLQQLFKERGAICEINNKAITEETLKGVKLLILTDPQSVDKTDYNLYKSKFDVKEIEAIKKFVSNGGNVIVTSKADYKDGSGEYSNGNQMNPILKAIGTELRVNDDEVVDSEKNGGQEFRLYLNRYSSPKYNLIEGINSNSDSFSFYSGCSLILAHGSEGKNVDFLVKGHDSTKTIDSDNQGDSIAVEKGKVYVTAAEELSNGARVVVSGNTFFSDFEIDGANGEQYCNIKLTENILNWMLPKKEIPIAPIGDIRKDDNKDGIPDLLGKKFTVEGRVTSQSEAISPKNAFFEVIYIEDSTGGICVFGVSKTPIKVGQKVRVTGTVDQYQGELELQVSDEDSEVKVIDESINEIKPRKLTTKDSMDSINGGRFIEVQGKVTKIEGTNLYIDDGTGESRLFVEGYIWDGKNEETKGKWDSIINIGDKVSAYGIGSVDPEGPRLRVRNTGEIKLIKGEDNENPTKPTNPEKPIENNNSTGNATNKLPQTGGFDYRIIIFMAVLAIVVGIYFVKDEKRKNLKQ